MNPVAHTSSRAVELPSLDRLHPGPIWAQVEPMTGNLRAWMLELRFLALMTR